MDKKQSLIFHYFIITVTAFLYFFIRLVYKNGVFFDFDMPRVALVVQDFIRHGTFLTSQYYMEESCWLNVPWGPALVYFYAFFIKISSNPMVVADLLSIFHFLGIIVMIRIGWKYFSPTVGVIAGLLLATNPYWVTYSRIIYQPAPIVTFIVFSMYLLLSTIRDKNKISNVLLPVSWSILFQIYIPTYSFIFTSLVFLSLNYKKIRIPQFILGVFISFLMFVPTIKFYVENPIYINRFIEAPSRFTPHEKTFGERLIKVLNSVLQIPVGGKFEWQAGYSYNDFVSINPYIKYTSIIIFAFVYVVFISNVYLIIVRKMSVSRLTIFMWSLCSFWSLVILWVSDLVPRYFLIVIPPIMLMIALFINDLMVYFRKNIFVRYMLFLVAISISIYWTTFSIDFDNFVGNYDYKNGRMYDVAETPYILFKKTLDWVNFDARRSGCNGFSLSNEGSDQNYTLWLETKYMLMYQYGYNYEFSEINNHKCKYVVNYESSAKDLNISNYVRFGPFVAYRSIKN